MSSPGFATVLRRFRNAWSISAGSFESIGIGCHVMACTESEARTLARRGGAFAPAVLDEGWPLARRDPPRSPAGLYTGGCRC